jgi:glyoxylase-like metal-dependent hydrolase (beta-lactamase superfamily II)
LILDDVAVQGFLIPGHTDGSAGWLIDGVLYLGDSAAGTTSGIAPAPWVFSVDTAQNRASLEALSKRLAPGSVKAVAFGHSGPAQQFTFR